MIELNVDLSFLAHHFELNTSRINSYSSKSIEEVMKQEEMNGNTKAAHFESMLQDPEKVAEMFRLMDPQNRYLIIKNLSSEDLSKLLPLLNKNDLIWGLKYFTKDKLMELMTMLPKQDLYNVVFQNFKLEDIIKLMPQDEIDKFLQSDKIEREDIMKYFKQLDQKELQKLFAQFFGPEFLGQETKEMSTEMMLQSMGGLEDQDFTKMIMQMELEDKGALIMNLVQNKPKLLMEFENKSIVRPMMLLEKAEILKTFDVLKSELVIKMVEHLPEDLIQVVATQIDPQVFSELLIDKFSDVLKQISL